MIWKYLHYFLCMSLKAIFFKKRKTKGFQTPNCLASIFFGWVPQFITPLVMSRTVFCHKIHGIITLNISLHTKSTPGAEIESIYLNIYFKLVRLQKYRQKTLFKVNFITEQSWGVLFRRTGRSSKTVTKSVNKMNL